ncbi:MAG TPA: hypothetical protein VG758_01335, partial [Hyphomicrobiaceae bacterium]|nr:hypothetical protein [Hyphomicrobiaceae bacterium]
ISNRRSSSFARVSASDCAMKVSGIPSPKAQAANDAAWWKSGARGHAKIGYLGRSVKPKSHT